VGVCTSRGFALTRSRPYYGETDNPVLAITRSKAVAVGCCAQMTVLSRVHCRHALASVPSLCSGILRLHGTLRPTHQRTHQSIDIRDAFDKASLLLMQACSARAGTCF
jgi:hypothetical protein